jgi:hypothetical protein
MNFGLADADFLVTLHATPLVAPGGTFGATLEVERAQCPLYASHDLCIYV